MSLLPIGAEQHRDAPQPGQTDQSIDDSGECSSGSEYAVYDVVTEQTYDAPYYRTDYGESETDTIECFHFDLQKIAHFCAR